MDIIREIRAQFNRRGYVAYGEQINMQNHMLQTAYFAEQKGADKELVAAAFLHDYGHLLLDLPEDIADHGIDGFHEDIAAKALKGYLPERIIEAIRLHVDAKRYLCAKNPKYLEQLTQASINTLKVQGGVMSAEEVAQFEESPWHKDAVAVRVYDDMGKLAELETPDLEYYLGVVEECLV